MQYVIDYCLASALFLGLICLFFFRQRVIPDTRSRLYAILLVLGFASLILDVVSAVVDSYAAQLSPLLVYASNMLFLFCVQANGPVFLLYTLILTGVFPKLKRRMQPLILLPFLLVTVLLLIAPFSQAGIFYVDSAGLYQRGSTFMALYIVMALYLITSVTFVIIYRNRIQKVKQYTIYAFIAITGLAMLIQSSNPNLLVNTTANAIALTMIYYVLQSPSERIDPMTRVFSAAAMPVLLQDLYEQRETFSMYVFFVHSIPIINHSMGTRIGDLLLTQFAAYLQEAFPKRHVLRMKGVTFAVIDAKRDGPVTQEELERIQAAVPREWRVANLDVQIMTTVAGVNSSSCKTLAEFSRTLEYILYETGRTSSENVLLADSAFRSKAAYRSDVAAALADAINHDGIQVHFQPIHRADGSLAALEALCRITDSQLGPLNPDMFIRIAEENGSIHQLGDQMLRKICRFIQLYQVEDWQLEHIGINLSSLQCLQDDLIERIREVTQEYNIRPGLLSFEITETEIITSMPVVRKNMDLLEKNGYLFLLDDFGSGFANFDYIASLPFTCIKIDKSLLWSAMEDDRQLALLAGIAEMMERLSLTTVVEGVETEEQAALVQSLGFSMQQGYYYAKPLPPEALKPYVEDCLLRHPPADREVRP